MICNYIHSLNLMYVYNIYMDVISIVSQKLLEQTNEIEDTKNKINEITSDLMSNMKLIQQRDIMIKRLKEELRISEKKSFEYKSNEDKVNEKIKLFESRSEQLENRIKELFEEENKNNIKLNDKQMELTKERENFEEKKRLADYEERQQMRQYEDRKNGLHLKYEKSQTKIIQLQELGKTYRNQTAKVLDQALTEHSKKMDKLREEIKNTRHANEELADRLSSTQQKVRFEVNLREKEIFDRMSEISQNERDKKEEFEANYNLLKNEIDGKMKKKDSLTAELESCMCQRVAIQDVIEKLRIQYNESDVTNNEQLQDFNKQMKTQKKEIHNSKKKLIELQKEHGITQSKIDQKKKEIFNENERLHQIQTSVEEYKGNQEKLLEEARLVTENHARTLCESEQLSLEVAHKETLYVSKLTSATENYKRVSNDARAKTEKSRELIKQLSNLKGEKEELLTQLSRKPKSNAILISPGSQFEEISISENDIVNHEALVYHKQNLEAQKMLNNMRDQIRDFKEMIEAQEEDLQIQRIKLQNLKKSSEIKNLIQRNLDLKKKKEQFDKMQEEIKQMCAKRL